VPFLRYLLLLSITLLYSCEDPPSRATSTIQIHPALKIPGMENQEVPDDYLDQALKNIRSEAVLNIASQKSGETPEDIQKSLSLAPRRGTDFIDITAAHNDRGSAVRIANAVTDAYIEHRKTIEINKVEKALEALDVELEKQADAVEDSRKALTVLIQQYGLHSNKPVGITEERYLQKAREKLEELEQGKAVLKTQIDKITNALPDELVRTAAGLKIPDNQVAFHYTKYRTEQESAGTLQAQGLGAGHSEIKLANARAAAALREAQKEVESLKEVLSVRLKLIKSQIERMQEMISRKMDSVGDKTASSSRSQHNYEEALSDYEALRDQHSEKKVKQQEARVLLNMDRDPVTIHERAK